MADRLLFLVNPKAGKTVIKASLIDIIKIFAEEGYAVEVYPTKNSEDTTRQVYENGGNYSLIVCAGGDGTLDSTVAGVIALERRLKQRVKLGYIPCGSTNDYGKSLRISRNPVTAAKAIIKGKPCCVDVGQLENRHFIYVAAFGLFTEISYSTPQNLKNSLGYGAYVIEAAKNLANNKPCKMELQLDDEIVKGEFIYGQITNSRSVGGIKNISPNKMQFSDGKFEVVLVRKPQKPQQMPQVVAGVLMGKEGNPYTVYRTASRIMVRAAEPVAWTVDGEYGGTYKDCRILNLHKALPIMLNVH